ncbi:hypothetical protein C1646_776370 [Rhizophagus diaphanus]|nr:hypothetical protein C1646_776370 [Rhizophagus diaphanus] [Rhizophagus sp. MUCL 43196]
MITRTFVLYFPPSYCKDYAIKSTLNHIQTENPLITWPQIDNSPINEFQTPGYIAIAFPMLYPTGKADLHTERIRNIKLAKYFKYLLRYKDGRGKIYVKQNLNDDELTVNNIQERIMTGDKHMADQSELHKLMPGQNTKENESTNLYHKNLVDNSHIAAWSSGIDLNGSIEAVFTYIVLERYEMDLQSNGKK